MASIIKANKLQDFAGNDILSSDGAGVITPNAAGINLCPPKHVLVVFLVFTEPPVVWKAWIVTASPTLKSAYALHWDESSSSFWVFQLAIELSFTLISQANLVELVEVLTLNAP